MQNISSQFKYTIDLGVSATKTTFKLKKTKKDKISHILVIVFMFLIGGLLAWDIVREASIVIDLIILIALVVVEIFSLLVPFIIIHMQKKFLKQLNLAEIEYTETRIEKSKCTETYFKDNKIMMQNVCDMTKLVGYEKKEDYIFLVFSNFACAIFDLKTLSISLGEFIQILDSQISKNKLAKTNKN